MNLPFVNIRWSGKGIGLFILTLLVTGCDSTTTTHLTSDPTLLEDLLDRTTREPATITFVDDSVYSTDAYRVTVRDDTLEWFEHDSVWTGAGLNDVASVTLSEARPLDGLWQGALLGPVAGLVGGVYALGSSNNDNGDNSSVDNPPLTASEALDVVLVFAALGEVIGPIVGVLNPPHHYTVYKTGSRLLLDSVR